MLDHRGVGALNHANRADDRRVDQGVTELRLQSHQSLASSPRSSAGFPGGGLGEAISILNFKRNPDQRKRDHLGFRCEKSQIPRKTCSSGAGRQRLLGHEKRILASNEYLLHEGSYPICSGRTTRRGGYDFDQKNRKLHTRGGHVLLADSISTPQLAEHSTTLVL